jgi:hypothetical protein
MADFTAVTHGFTPQLYMSELIDAANERRLAAIYSGATGLPPAIPSTAESVQSFQGGAVKPTHLLIQEMLEALAVHYVNHDASAPYLTPFTVATWRTSAGLNSSGFRRATEWDDPSADPTFDYGLIQTGDIAGYWVWEDIVKGLKALKWTRTDDIEPWGSEVKTASAGGDINSTNWQQVIAAYEADFAAASWTYTQATGSLANIDFFMGLDYMNNARLINTTLRRSFPCYDPGILVALQADVDFWLYPDGSGGQGRNYYAWDGKPVDTWFKFGASKTISHGTISIVYADQLITGTGPSLSTEYTPPSAENPSTGGYFNISSAYALFKWRFTNS